MNMTGVSRAMALNISYALWGIVLSALFTDARITTTLIMGALVISLQSLTAVGICEQCGVTESGEPSYKISRHGRECVCKNLGIPQKE